jgi:hypothetical protein
MKSLLVPNYYKGDEDLSSWIFLNDNGEGRGELRAAI